MRLLIKLLLVAAVVSTIIMLLVHAQAELQRLGGGR